MVPKRQHKIQGKKFFGKPFLKTRGTPSGKKFENFGVKNFLEGAF